MSFWKTKAFKAVQEVWYRLLEESGFEDAERLVGDDMMLSQFATAPFKRVSDLDDLKNKEAYYKLLSDKIRDWKFRNWVDEHILRRYADGWKIMDICRELDKIGEHRCRNTIRFTIRRYEARWGMNVYSRRQLNLKE